MLRHVSSVQPLPIAPPGKTGRNEIRKSIAEGTMKNNTSHPHDGNVRKNLFAAAAKLFLADERLMAVMRMNGCGLLCGRIAFFELTQQ